MVIQHIHPLRTRRLQSVISERYFFLCDEKPLHHPQFAPLLQTDEFKPKATALPRYGADQTGQTMTIGAAFAFADIAGVSTALHLA